MSDLASIIDQMHAAGILGLRESDLIVDGVLHRFRPEGTRSKTGWYVIYEFVTRSGDRIYSGVFGDWRSGIRQKISLEGARLSDDEREQLKRRTESRQREQEKARKTKARRAALRASQIWCSKKLQDTGQNEYLKRKQVRGYGVKYSESGALIIPIIDAGAALHGLQVIYPKGKERVTRDGDKLDKDFWPFGMNPQGHFHVIGAQKDLTRMVICEGYATGASVHEGTGLTVFIAFNAGNLLPVAKVLRNAYPDADIIIAGDDDYLTYKPVNNPGKVAAWKAAKTIDGKAVFPKFKNRNGEKWTDFNDLHVIEGLDAVRECFLLADSEWKFKLSRASQGDIKPDVHNVFLILENDERWLGVLRYDRFTYDVVKVRTPPFKHNAKTGAWTETDTTRLRLWLADNYHFTPKSADALEAVIAAAEMAGYHPVLDYLHGLKWDGVPRLRTWLSDFLGATQNDYSSLVGTLFLVGAVARAHAEPENLVKMDNVLVLEGGQGLGKSTVVSILGGPFYADTHFDIGSKDGYQQLRGVWFYEIPELNAFNKAETNSAKSFFTSKKDNYRPSYGKRSYDYPRQTVFIGTTNQDHYFKDVTGNRRYWPVRCKHIDLDALRAARDQLFAEALHKYRNGAIWHVMYEQHDLFTEQQEARLLADEIEFNVVQWLDDPAQRGLNEFAGSVIMAEALKMTPDKQTPPNQIRLGQIMRRLGWGKKQIWMNGKDGPRVWVYTRPDSQRVDAKIEDDEPI